VGFRNAFCFVAFFPFASLFATDLVTAQTIAYRQANLASNLPNVANNVTPRLVNPFGIAFLSGEPFFIADNNAGRVSSAQANRGTASITVIAQSGNIFRMTTIRVTVQ